MIPKAFIFDLDGVLVDTARCHYNAWKMLADNEKLHFDEKINQQLKGVSRERSLELILKSNHRLGQYSSKKKQEMARTKNEIYVQMIQQLTPEDILPGIIDFLAQAKKNDIRLAVASASRNAFLVLERLGIYSQFDYISDANKVLNPKPHPEVFLNCASALGVSTNSCVGFEDAQAGIEAICAAGMYSVGIGVEVTTQVPDILLKKTEELDLNLILHQLARMPCKNALI